MSNQAFDRLVARQNLQSAIEAHDCWGRALVRTDIDAAELDFLARSFRGSKQRIIAAREQASNWWG